MPHASSADSRQTAPTLERGILLPPRGLSIPRTLLALAGGLAALVAIVLEPGSLDILASVELGLLGVAILAMLLDRVDAHVFVWSVLWGVMAWGATQTMHGLRPWVEMPEQVRAVTVLLGPAVALLSLGRAGLDGEHGAFFPLVMRRSILTMMVVGLCIAHVLAVVALASLPEQSGLLVAVAGSTPVLLTAGVVGLSRTRTWGLLAYLGGIVSAAAYAGLALSAPAPAGMSVIPPTDFLAVVWAFGGALALLVGLPVLAALVLRPAPRPAGRPWGQLVHAAMVLAFVGWVFGLAV